ncbi:MAG: hypothetical protein ACRD8W_01500 [Nitrososphaeraceae archaeon]
MLNLNHLMNPDGMIKVIGTLAVHPEKLNDFRDDPDGFVFGITGDRPDEEELRFFRDYYIIDILKEFGEKLDIRYTESGTATRKGR